MKTLAGRSAPTLAVVALTGLMGMTLACLSGGSSEPVVERVQDPEVLRFAQRIEKFYGSIENRSLNALVTFEDSDLHGFFQGEGEFADYYASLADQVKSARFRYARADAVHVREFRFAEPGRAEVDVVLVGKHQRALRFWEIQIMRTDAWIRGSTGDWVVAPEKL